MVLDAPVEVGQIEKVLASAGPTRPHSDELCKNAIARVSDNPVEDECGK